MNLIFKVSFNVNNINTNKFTPIYSKDFFKGYKANRVKMLKDYIQKYQSILITDFSSTATKNKDNGVIFTYGGKTSLKNKVYIRCKTIIQK